MTRARTRPQGITLTRASQTVLLSDRGDERYRHRDDVRHSPVEVVPFRLSRSFTPQVDFFNIGNADTVVNHNVAVGGTYLLPSEILAPRIIRIGFSLNF